MVDRLRELGIETEERAGRAVALPAGVTDAVLIVRLARESGWSVVPAWLPDGRLERTSIALSVERLDAVDELAAPDLMAVVGAGLTCAALDERARQAGLYWPVSDVADGGERIGDLIARAPGNWTRMGNTLRRYTLGMTAVLADGEILQTGSRTVKWVTGYDLRQLFTGSWGTLGVVTGLILRLESLANREAVDERFRREFQGLAEREAGPSQGSVLVLERLKRELDPHGVFPPIDVIGTGASAA
jgi:FAD/FMN-containing dehydrogenase